MTSLTVSGERAVDKETDEETEESVVAEERAVDKETGEETEESVVAEVGPELEIAPPAASAQTFFDACTTTDDCKEKIIIKVEGEDDKNIDGTCALVT